MKTLSTTISQGSVLVAFGSVPFLILILLVLTKARENFFEQVSRLMGVAFGIGGISGVFYAGAGIAIATLAIFRYCLRLQ